MNPDYAIIHTDGGARGNPGPAAIGYTIRQGAGLLVQHGQIIPPTTNNQAEYCAIIAALKRARELGLQQIELRADSELVIRQLRREYKVKKKELTPLFLEASQLLQTFSSYRLISIPRSDNVLADRLVNQALDAAV